MNSNIDTFKCTHNYILYAFAAQITEDFKFLGTLNDNKCKRKIRMKNAQPLKANQRNFKVYLIWRYKVHTVYVCLQM